MASYSAGLLKVDNLTATGSSTAVATSNLTAGTFNVTGAGGITTPTIAVGNITGTVDLNTQLSKIQATVGSNKTVVSLSDQVSLQNYYYLNTILQNYSNTLKLYLAAVPDSSGVVVSSTSVTYLDGSFVYSHPNVDASKNIYIDGSGVGQLWLGDFNPLQRNYFGPTGEKTTTLGVINWDVLTRSICSIGLIVRMMLDPTFMIKNTPYYYKTPESYDNPQSFYDFKLSVYIKMFQLVDKLNVAMTAKVNVSSFVSNYLALTNTCFTGLRDEVVYFNQNYLSGQTNGYYSNYQSKPGPSSVNIWTFNSPQYGAPGYGTGDVITYPLPQTSGTFNGRLTTVVDSSSWKGQCLNLPLCFGDVAAMFRQIGDMFAQSNPVFHQFVNGSTASNVLGAKYDSSGNYDLTNTFNYYNAITDTTTSQVRYYTELNGGSYFQKSSFSTFTNVVLGQEDSFYTNDQTISGVSISAMFNLPALWKDVKRNTNGSYVTPLNNDLAAIYTYLNTPSLVPDGSSIIFQAQQVWTNYVIPASLYAYNKYKDKFEHNIVDDQYPGPWRTSIVKAIDHIDVINSPYLIYFKDGTTQPLATPGVKQYVEMYNNNLAELTCTTSDGLVPIYKKIDLTKSYLNGYTSFQDITNNYTVVNEQATTVNDDILSGADTTRKTFGARMYECGKYLSTLFNDLEEFSIYQGLGDPSGGFKIPIDSSGNYLTQSQFNTVVNGSLWNVQKVFDVSTKQLALTRSDWDVLGYYYGRHPNEPVYYVYNTAIFNSVGVDGSGYRTDASGNNVIQKRALQGGSNQYVVETNFNTPSGVKFDVYNNTGATPYARTATAITSGSSLIPNSIIRANFDPVGIPVSAKFDYCLLEHYQISLTTGKPTILNGLYVPVVSATNFVNSTGGNTGGGTTADPIPENGWKCRSFVCQLNNRVFLSWYNTMINQYGANNNSCLYDSSFISFIKCNYVFMIKDAFNTSSSTGALIVNPGSQGLTNMQYYGPTYGCTGQNYTGPVSIPNRRFISFNSYGTKDPQNITRPTQDLTTCSHELFGHGIQLIYRNLSGYVYDASGNVQYSALPVTWATASSNFTSQGLLAVRDNYTPDAYQYQASIQPYTFGAQAEGYATLMEIMNCKYDNYRTVDIVNITLGNTPDYYNALYALCNLARIVPRLMVCAGVCDPTSAAGKGDISSFPWVVRAISDIQHLSNADAMQRLIFHAPQQSSYAIGLISCLDAITQIINVTLAGDPGKTFRQCNFDYWRISEGKDLTGAGVTRAALGKPASYWTGTINVPNYNVTL